MLHKLYDSQEIPHKTCECNGQHHAVPCMGDHVTYHATNSPVRYDVALYVTFSAVDISHFGKSLVDLLNHIHILESLHLSWTGHLY